MKMQVQVTINGTKENVWKVITDIEGSVNNIKSHIRWLCEKTLSKNISVRDRMLNAKIELKDIDERLKWLKGQFPDLNY